MEGRVTNDVAYRLIYICESIGEVSYMCVLLVVLNATEHPN